MSGRLRTVALAGNPNVGKSTVFNALTGMRQHTGNWPGKTMSSARGKFYYNSNEYMLIDLPGTYSLIPHSADEEIAREFIQNGGVDCVIVVCDATCLERNLNLALQTIEISSRVVVCVNLMDEAEKKGIDIDLRKLENLLETRVVGIVARSNTGLDKLVEAVADITDSIPNMTLAPDLSQSTSELDKSISAQRSVDAAEKITKQVVTYLDPSYNRYDRKLDKILTGKTGIPVMLALLWLVFWLTLSGANIPSQIIADGLFHLQDVLTELFWNFGSPEWLHGLLVLGMYRVVAWVVAVMLPPMAIFFPLFTLLEDFGYLPRIAFNLDHQFKKACACGKQALTMCMGFGCNAAGIVGCRIIDSPREKLIAVLTNNFVPCNGRFPTLIAIISMFFVGRTSGLLHSLSSTLILACAIVLGVSLTFVVSWLLSNTILKGEPSSFTLELPPYRMPQFGRVIVRSLLDRTIFVLGRAVMVAAPAGMLIWIMANCKLGNLSILAHVAGALDPIGSALGLDGVILLAFVLGFPANEIVIPIIIMSYLMTGSIIELGSLTELKALLVQNGWTWQTAVSLMLFCLIHWPCSTTCLTIKKETGSLKWTALAIAIPTVIGMTACFLFTCVVRILRLA